MRKDCKLIFICILTTFILCGFAKNAGAAYYDINLSIGFDNQAKYGRYVPVTIELYSEDDFEGMLSINTELENGSEQIVSYPVTLTGGDYEIIKTYFAMYDNKMGVSLKNPAGEVVKNKSAKLEIFEDDYTELFAGVLSKNQQMISMFDDINLGEYSDMSFPYILTRSFGLTTDNIGENTLYTLDCLDIIIVTWDMVMELDMAQVKALLEWAASGKILIIEYNTLLVTELCEAYDNLVMAEADLEQNIIQAEDLYEIYGVTSSEELYKKYNLDILKELSKVYEEVYKARRSNDELRPGLWIYSTDYYKGRVGIIDPGSGRDFFSYTTSNNNELLGLILGKACTLEMIDEIINYDMYYTNYDFSYAVEHMLSAMHGKEVPKITEYIFIICIYIILVGPVLFFVLASAKKHRYLLPCVIIMAMVFSFIVYRKSEDTRFTDIFLQYANLVDIKGERIDETAYFSVNVPYNDTYYMKFNSGYEIKPLLKMQAGDSGENYLEILYDKDITKLTLKKSVPFSKEHFEAVNSHVNISEWDIDVDVTYYYKNISGTITNNSGKDLEDTALILYDKLILVGDIKDKEVVDISKAKRITLPYHSSDLAAEVARNEEEEQGDAAAKNKAVVTGVSGREAVVDYVVNRYFEEKETTPIFIGFAEEEPDFVSGYEAYGYTMFRKEVEVITDMGNLLFEPVGYENIENKNNNTNYDAYSNTTYSSSVRLQYNFEDKSTLYRIVFDNGVDSGDDTAYYGSFSGEVFFYNYTTLEYDLIDISREYFDIEELTQYLFATENGGYNLTVQYNVETEGKYRYTEIKMPFVSVIRRLDNAESTEP